MPYGDGKGAGKGAEKFLFEFKQNRPAQTLHLGSWGRNVSPSTKDSPTEAGEATGGTEQLRKKKQLRSPSSTDLMVSPHPTLTIHCISKSFPSKIFFSGSLSSPLLLTEVPSVYPRMSCFLPSALRRLTSLVGMICALD